MVNETYNLQSIGIGVLYLLLIMSIGFILSNRKLINKSGCDGLSHILLWICFPALILIKITTSFSPTTSQGWWILPISSIIMCFCGMGIGFILLKTLKGFNAPREFIISSGFQNCGYLPMSLVAFVFSAEASNIRLVYIFLFIIGFNMTLWSFGFGYLKNDFLKNFKLSTVITPPVVSTVVAIILVLLFGNNWMPNIISEPLRLIGNSSFPLSLILLGAILAEHRGYRLPHISALGCCILAKLIILPLVTIFVIQFLPISEMYKFIIFLQSTMPTAVSLVIIGSQAKADNNFFSGVILYSHICAVITVPVWLMIFNKIYQ